MKRMLSSLLTLALALGLGGGAVSAKTCRDASGKFMKCPPGAMMMHKPKCRDASGKFMKCSDKMMGHHMMGSKTKHKM